MIVVRDVSGAPVVTAEDLDQMAPREVDAVWRASIVTDPDTLPGEYVDTLRRRATERLARREARAAS